MLHPKLFLAALLALLSRGDAAVEPWACTAAHGSPIFIKTISGKSYLDEKEGYEAFDMGSWSHFGNGETLFKLPFSMTEPKFTRMNAAGISPKDKKACAIPPQPLRWPRLADTAGQISARCGSSRLNFHADTCTIDESTHPFFPATQVRHSQT